MSKYNPAYCAEIINAGSMGLSFSAFAGQIGVARNTILNWAREYPAFAAAKDIAAAKSALFWETALLELAATGKGNATAIIFALKNRASADWRERIDVDHTTGGEPLPARSDVEVARELAFILARGAAQPQPTLQ